MVGAAVLVFVMLMRQTPMFESTAALAIDRGRKAVRFADGDLPQRIEFSLLNTYRDMILSRPVLSSALTSVGALEQPPYNKASDPVELFARALVHSNQPRLLGDPGVGTR